MLGRDDLGRWTAICEGRLGGDSKQSGTSYRRGVITTPTSQEMRGRLLMTAAQAARKAALPARARPQQRPVTTPGRMAP